MGLGELLDEGRRRELFPVVGELVYLAHAGVCPLPRCVVEGMEGYLGGALVEDQEVAGGGLLEGVRGLVAGFLGVGVDEVCFVGSTSDGLSLVASGFPWVEGDNVVVYRDDYPSNVYPWLALRERGVEVRSVEVGELGVVGVDDVLGCVDGRTRLVALASCHFVSGYRLDVAEVGGALRERGVAFCLDGIQSVGAFGLDLGCVDFMAADGHKWLLGPCGAGVLFVRREWQERLGVGRWGWRNVLCHGFVARDELVFCDGARRFEAGTVGLVGLAGLGAAVGLLSGFGLGVVGGVLGERRGYLVEGLRGGGWDVLCGDVGGDRCGGLVSFRRDGVDLKGVLGRLGEAGVRVSLRGVRGGLEFLRLSPHFYNTVGELDVALECL